LKKTVALLSEMFGSLMQLNQSIFAVEWPIEIKRSSIPFLVDSTAVDRLLE